MNFHHPKLGTWNGTISLPGFNIEPKPQESTSPRRIGQMWTLLVGKLRSGPGPVAGLVENLVGAQGVATLLGPMLFDHSL